MSRVRRQARARQVRTTWPGAAVVPLLVVLAAGSACTADAVDRPVAHRAERTPEAGSAVPRRIRAAETTTLVRAQVRAVAHRHRHRFVATYDQRASGAARQAETVYANLAGLHVADFALDVLTVDSEQPSGGRGRRPGTSGWTADVAVTWRLPRFDRAAATAVLTYTVVRHGRRTVVVDIRPAEGSRTPVWLTGRLHIRRAAHVLAVARSAGAARELAAGLAVAYRDVRSVTGWNRPGLVGYWPADAAGLDALTGAPPGSYDGIAAVTTTVDGSGRDRSPVAIVVNPDVFVALTPVGRHVVLTHEATHAETRAGAAELPLWVSEGFADYVGIGSVDVPLRISARAAIDEVRRTGLPAALPEDAEFIVTGRRLEAAYERAWLVMRTAAGMSGQRSLVAFYGAVAQHPDDVDAALADELGTSRHRLTVRWRASLDRLADAP